MKHETKQQAHARALSLARTLGAEMLVVEMALPGLWDVRPVSEITDRDYERLIERQQQTGREVFTVDASEAQP